jgi:hypothetical protein
MGASREPWERTCLTHQGLRSPSPGLPEELCGDDWYELVTPKRERSCEQVSLRNAAYLSPLTPSPGHWDTCELIWGLEQNLQTLTITARLGGSDSCARHLDI